MARAERTELADLIASLSDDQWNAESLCAPWRVREVAAHVLGYGLLTPVQFATRLARGRSLHHSNEIDIAHYRDRTPRQLSDLIRDNLEPSGLTARFGGRVALAEAMIHQQDIRRSLSIPREIPPGRLRAALDFTRYAPLIRGAWRVRGVHLTATDLAWAHGVGPQVRGSGEALLMAMAGRATTLDELAGPGKQRLIGLLRA